MNNNFISLDKDLLINFLDEDLLDSNIQIFVSQSTGSTNDDAKNFLSKQSSLLSIHTSEQQIAGKGRNGKKWISPRGKNIYLSIGWLSDLKYAQLDGLSLAIGTILASTLNKFTQNKVGIKWPNDLLIEKKKISGILIETIDLNNQVGIVIGIGINVHMSEEEGKEINQSWISLDQVTDSINDRNKIIADIVNKVYQLTSQFTKEGFKPFKLEYESLDMLKGKRCIVNIKDIHKTVDVLGVNDKGEMLVKDGSQNLTLRYGEVSIREL
ncbi:biotin--[acetyl-CoA-carboxylase] ligase [SAR86 cluster bacterium]|nr:biotin--[acetyl-CoA-carboxylase] ligase [SAR86 cluster bacterium]